MRDANRSPRRAFAALAFTFTCLVLGPSCGGPGPNPPAQVAREALETSLKAWRDGKKPADLATTTPPVQVVDNEWTSGRKLGAFEILRDEPSESDKRFVVKLTYTAPATDAEVTYVVIGSSPVAVFRAEDFARTMNMDNNPIAKTKKKR